MDLKSMFNKGKGSQADKAEEAAEAVKEAGSNQPEPQERHPNREATEERQADANRQESKERRHP